MEQPLQKLIVAVRYLNTHLMLKTIQTFIFLLLSISVFANSEIIPIKKVSSDQNNCIQIHIDAKKEFYYLLKVKNDISKPFDHFTVMALGIDGELVITEPISKYSLDHYQVMAFAKTAPGDVDSDGFNDLDEFQNPVNQSPFNAGKSLNFKDGAVHVPNREVFKRLSYQGEPISNIDEHLKDLEFVKFYIVGTTPTTAQLYFMNSNTHSTHAAFKVATKINPVNGAGEMPLELKGEIVYHPNVKATNGTLGTYRFEFEPNDSFSFDKVQMAFELIAANMPFLKNNLAYCPMPNAALPLYKEEKAQYDHSRIPILLEEDIFEDVQYLALNQAEGYGFLRKMEFSDIPNIRDIVVYEHLPNEMSRTGGIISAVPQTPLSHVNLRAIQDKVPNCYIKNPLQNEKIKRLLGKYVHFVVRQNEFILEESDLATVNAWFDAVRPKEPQKPPLNLTRTKILKLDAIRFDMSDSYGVKCANLAEMRTFGFAKETVPDGFGIPFHFYRAFMEYNGFFEKMIKMRADPEFANDATIRDSRLKSFRKEIEKGIMPQWMLDELAVMQNSFPRGTSIRCRSSTNNEDLPDFSGAGLYDSKTQKPDEGHIEKSIKQVFASMWNFRAYEEREFYRVDHLVASMGILCHPNEKDERMNGVGVSTDPIYHTEKTFYLNNQIGEEMVTNPEALSIPEEIILDATQMMEDYYTIIRYSNLSNTKLVLESKYLNQMRNHLAVIHNRFKKLYKAENNSLFAIEIEFKVTKEGNLSIKQARPWLGPNTGSGTDFFEEESEKPELVAFAYPNPFEKDVTVKYEIQNSGSVQLELFNVEGKKMMSRAIGFKSAGVHQEPVTLGNVPVGSMLILKLILESGLNTHTKTIKIFRK